MGHIENGAVRYWEENMKPNVSIDHSPCLAISGNQRMSPTRSDERVRKAWQSKVLFLTRILMVACVLIFSTVSFAAKPTPPPEGMGTLMGEVTVAGTNTAIVGASVTAKGLESYSTTTNTRGDYSIDVLPGGYDAS